MSKEKLIIIGASGHGKVVADIAMKMNQWKEIFFLDDAPDKKEVLGFSVLGKTEESIQYKEEADFFVAIGNNLIREKVLLKLESEGFSITTLIHPSAVIGLDVLIGEGTAIMPGAVVNAASTIGKGVIVNTSASIDHDCLINDFVHVSPGVRIAGTVVVGERVWLGINSTVINNITIVSDCVIGAGSLVLKKIDEIGTYIGNPIRRINRK